MFLRLNCENTKITETGKILRNKKPPIDERRFFHQINRYFFPFAARIAIACICFELRGLVPCAFSSRIFADTARLTETFDFVFVACFNGMT
jgi:hypothetical protein